MYKPIGFKPGEIKQIEFIAENTGLTRTSVVRCLLVTEFNKFERENKGKEELKMSFQKTDEKGKLKPIMVMFSDTLLKDIEPYLEITGFTYSSFIRALVYPVIKQLYESIMENGVDNALIMAINGNAKKLGDKE